MLLRVPLKHVLPHWLPLMGVALLAVVTAAPAAASVCPAPEIFGPIVNPHVEGSMIVWEPLVSYELLTLRVSAPCGDFTRTFKEGETPFFDVRDVTREVDGSYSYELVVQPRIDPDVAKQLEEVRGTPQEQFVVLELWDKGLLPRGPFRESGSFEVSGGVILPPDAIEKTDPRLVTSTEGLESRSPGSPGNVAGASEEIRNASAAGSVLTNADGIIRNSLCVGFDCPNSPSFSDTTILLMENNTRIKFDDTSTISGFPNRDWELQANSNSSGGGSYFAINDCGNSSQGGCAEDPLFIIEANAPANSIRVDNGGRVGFGTANPSVELHVVDGDTPALRLQQDTSSGFAAQTWDVAGNETSFFIRDVTNGSQLPFRIQPGADSNSLYIANDNNVGMGTSSPEGDGLEIERTGSVTQRILLRLQNNGAPQSEFANSDNNITWRFGQNSSGDFVINDTADLGTAEMRITTGGTVFVNGGQVHPDYVFDAGYPLMSLTDLERFIEEKGHLPKVQTAEERERDGGVNITELPLQLLQKVEELTLYTIRQEKRIDTLSRQNDDLLALVDELRAKLDH
jgi:hypothetical protein